MLRYVGISVAYLEVFVERCCIHGGILLALSVLFNPFVLVHDTLNVNFLVHNMALRCCSHMPLL